MFLFNVRCCKALDFLAIKSKLPSWKNKVNLKSGLKYLKININNQLIQIEKKKKVQYNQREWKTIVLLVGKRMGKNKPNK